MARDIQKEIVYSNFYQQALDNYNAVNDEYNVHGKNIINSFDDFEKALLVQLINRNGQIKNKNNVKFKDVTLEITPVYEFDEELYTDEMTGEFDEYEYNEAVTSAMKDNEEHAEFYLVLIESLRKQHRVNVKDLTVDMMKKCMKELKR